MESLSHPSSGAFRRTLVVATNLPYPPRGGVDMRNWQHAAAAAELGRAAMVGLSGTPTPTPAPGDGFELWTTCTAAPQGERSDSLGWLRDPLGHPGDRWYSHEAVAELRSLAERFAPEVAIVEQLWLHRYIEPLRELGCTVVLDAHNLEGPLHRELAAGRRDPLSAKLAERAETIEALAFTAADQVWVCSERDAELASERYGVRPIVVPNAIDVERLPFRDGERAAATVVYSGMFGYPPNVTAAQRLTDAIFPRFGDGRDDARLVLVGRDPSPAMRAAAEREARVEVTGAVDDTLPHLLDATLTAIPLVEGGGTRFKVLEALAVGLPVVSTAKGVEGLDLVDGEHYLRAESDDDFAEALSTLCDDPGLRSALAHRGRERVGERYSFAAVRERVAAALGATRMRTSAG